MNFTIKKILYIRILHLWTEPRGTPINNKHKKFGEDGTCGSGDAPADRQTDEHADRQTRSLVVTNGDRPVVRTTQ